MKLNSSEKPNTGPVARPDARPSSRWTGLSDLATDSVKYAAIQRFISTTNFRQLEILAIRARRKQTENLPTDLTCSMDRDRFTSGANNIVMEVAFSDGCYWIARIPYTAEDNGIPNHLSESFLSEIATMRVVRNNTTIPVPQIYAFDASMDQEFGYPYMFMEYLRGHTLQGLLAEMVTQDHRGKVAKQLANVYFELSQLTYERIGRLRPGETADQPVTLTPMAGYDDTISTSLEYFYTQRMLEEQEALTQHPNDVGWATACWLLKITIPHFTIEEKLHGKFPLCHLDIHHENLLFDDEYNLVGIIDWSNAQTVPLERFVLCPEFIPFPGRTEEANQPILEFKGLFLNFLYAMESAENSSKKLLSSFISSTSYETAFRCVYSNSNRTLWMGKRVAKLMFGEILGWEQLKEL